MSDLSTGFAIGVFLTSFFSLAYQIGKMRGMKFAHKLWLEFRSDLEELRKLWVDREEPTK